MKVKLPENKVKFVTAGEKMYHHKFLIALLIFLLISQTFVFTQDKNVTSASPTDNAATAPEVSPEIKEKAYGILRQAVSEAGQFTVPSNRVYFQIIAADLLWEKDEKEARGIYLAAQSEIRMMIDQTEAATTADEEGNIPPTADEEDELISNYDAKPLREQLVLSLAEHDPKAALDALQALKRSPGYKPKEGYDSLADEDQLELKISAIIAKKDPNRAFEIAKRNLDKGFPDNLLEVLGDIYKKDSSLGAKFAKEILSKIKVSKIESPDYGNVSNTAGNMAVSAANMATGTTAATISPGIQVWTVSQFLKTSVASLRTAEKANKANKDKKVEPLLTESEVGELANLLAQNFVARKQLFSYEVGAIMPELIKYAPAQTPLIKRKLGAEGVKQAEDMSRSFIESEDFDSKTAAEIAAEAEKSAPDKRDMRFSDAVRKALADEDLEKAKKYFDQIKDKETYAYLKEEIETQLPLVRAKQGNIEEVRKLIGKGKTSGEKIAALCELAKTVAVKNTAKEAQNAAVQLIDEARQMLPSRFKKSTQLVSFVEVGRAYAFVDAEQSFNFLENTIPAANDLIAAAVIVDDFNEYGATRRDELTYDTMQRQFLRVFPKSVEVLQKYAAADFDRTAGFPDKFTRSDVRAFARLQIAVALLDPHAAEKETEAAKTAQQGGAID